jgi:hypothetical protein
VKGLVLVDPVLMRGSVSRLYNTPLLNMFIQKNSLSKQALRRRREFESASDAAEGLRGRGAFRTWRSPFLDDYVVDGVLRQDDGRFELACTPEWESAVFSAHRYRPWAALRRLRRKRIPIVILQAEKESTTTPDTHFVPMERPYVVRDALKMLFEGMIEGNQQVDYVGAVRRTIDGSIGIMD